MVPTIYKSLHGIKYIYYYQHVGCHLLIGGGSVVKRSLFIVAPIVSVVVGSLLIVTPIVGFCYCCMFCYALLCVHSSFATIDGDERVGS